MLSIQTYSARRKQDKPDIKVDSELAVVGTCNITYDLVVDGANVLDQLALRAPIANPTFTGTVNGITKSMITLGNVDNTNDLHKPVSTLTQNAINLKANSSDVYTTSVLDSMFAQTQKTC